MIEAAHSETSSTTRTASRPIPSLSGTRLWTSAFLSREERHALEDAVSPARSVGHSNDLCREGAPTDTLFIITNGWACRYATTREGGRQLPALLVPGDIANLDSLMFDRPDYGVRTITPARIVPLTRDRALSLAERYAGIARSLGSAWSRTRYLADGRCRSAADRQSSGLRICCAS